MSRVIEAIVPPGGWKYEDEERKVTIPSFTYAELVRAVVKYRLDNRIPVGNVEADIEEQICRKFPHMCHAVPGAHVTVEVHVPGSHVDQLTQRTDDMIAWLASRVDDHSSEALELKSEAQRRAAICLNCPQNVAWKSGCGECKASVDQLSTTIRIGNDVARGRKLTACQILRQENRAAVWLRMDRIGNDPRLPGHCWAKR